MSYELIARLPPILGGLKDIQDVQGSFLFARSGRVIARDLPPIFAEDMLADVAVRSVRLWETLGEVDRTLDQSVIRYRDYKLFIRPVVQGLLCAIAPLNVNAAALKMALNLVVKRVNPILAEVDIGDLAPRSQAAPSTGQPPAVAQARSSSSPEGRTLGAAPAPGPAARRSFVYRGRRYEV